MLSAVEGGGQLTNVGRASDVDRDAGNVARCRRVIGGAGEATDGQKLVDVYKACVLATGIPFTTWLLGRHNRLPCVLNTLEIVAVGVRIIIVITLLVLLALMHAVCAHGSNLGHIKALIGADALVLKVVLILVNVRTKIHVTLVRQSANGPADGLARRWDVIHVQVDCLGVGQQGQRRKSERNSAAVVHCGVRDDWGSF